MKNIFAVTWVLSAIALLFAFSTVLAGEVVKAYELAESGITIEFPMTDEGIAVEDEERYRLAALNETDGNTPRKRVRVFELGESGQTISFPLTAQEVAAEDAKIAGRAIPRRVNSGKPNNHVTVFELSESGQTIEFPVESIDTVMVCSDLSTEKYC